MGEYFLSPLRIAIFVVLPACALLKAAKADTLDRRTGADRG